ncbi:MAG: DUF4132 domain-containing protein [Acidimicrobiales bacterium]
MGWFRQKMTEALQNVGAPAAGNARPVTRDDVIGLARFGGSWRAAIEALLPPEGVGPFLDYVGSGKVSSADPGAGSANRFLAGRPLLGLELALAMPPAERSHLLAVVRLDPSDQFSTWYRSAADPALAVTFDDLDRYAPIFNGAVAGVINLLVSERAYITSRMAGIEGFERFVVAHQEMLRAGLTPPRAAHAGAWEALGEIEPAGLACFAAELCSAATANTASLRAVVRRLLGHVPDGVVADHLRRLALEAGPAQRARAIELMAEVVDPGGRPDLVTWADEHLADDRNPAVQEAVATLRLATQVTERPQLPEPDLPVHSGHVLIAAMANGDESAPDHLELGQLSWEEDDWGRLAAGHLARIVLTLASDGWTYNWRNLRKSAVDLPEPLVISAVAERDGRDEADVVATIAALADSDLSTWSDEEIGRWAGYHAESIASIVRHPHRNEFVRTTVLRLVAGLEVIPPVVRSAVVEVVVNGRRADREIFDHIVGDADAPAVAGYLGSSKQRDRAGAACWFKAHPDAAAASTKPLLVAARAERDDRIKADLLAALEQAGAPISEFIGRESALAEATRAMKKKSAMPASISWLPVDSLPELRWVDGTPVDREITRWFLASAARGKTAEPSPILRRHLAETAPASRAAFGAALLDLWMAQDVRTKSPEEARADVDAEAATLQRQLAAGHLPEFDGRTLDDLLEDRYRVHLTMFRGSATSSKGLLALVAASAGPEVTDRVMVYVRKHRGRRGQQVRALLQMLAWIDEPATIQAVMSVAARFSPQGIRREARHQAELLAERHGWTMEDLADRSVPDGGFGRDGRLVLDYGDRTVTVHLADDLTVSLTNDETGASIRSLPRGRAGEDQGRIKELKSALSSAKTDVATAARSQPDRLHQAMCAQRCWSPDDLRRYVLDHPIMARLASRLVWAAADPGGGIVAFRPLTDRTLLNALDDEVDLDPAALVTIAHHHLVGDDGAAAWQAHLVDYEIQPLFAQFGRPDVPVGDGRTTVADFVGYRHNDGSIRAQIKRLGWELGVALDNGVAHDLVKEVPGAELQAVVDLDGGVPYGLAEVGRWPCSLGQFYFVAADVGYPDPGLAVPLATVPPIPLSELYAEVEAMAKAGSGREATPDAEADR